MTNPIFNRKDYASRRKALRNHATAPEQNLWRVLRGKQMGVKFRRQHGIGHYIVDFYSPECTLVIEVDGDSHFTDAGEAYDAARDAYMHSLGLKVLRFTNAQVMGQLDEVCEVIWRVVRERR